jgi:uncharacterized membrane protein
MLILHIASGVIALIVGTMVLALKKGDSLHKRIGQLFIAAILAAAISSIYLYHLVGETPLMGVFCIYLVLTSWLTVRSKPGTINPLTQLLAAGIAIMSLGLFYLGYTIEGAKVGSEIPAQVFYVFGLLALLCAALDVKMILHGGISGKHRIARHLWRMILGMVIALMALLGQDIYPDWFIDMGVVFLPLLAIVLVLIIWLVRVLKLDWRVE